ncbi:hypothetical protein SAMN05660284_02841, partial [Formivibrio citricus]
MFVRLTSSVILMWHVVRMKETRHVKDSARKNGLPVGRPLILQNYLRRCLDGEVDMTKREG